jgi:hypothetical protein
MRRRPADRASTDRYSLPAKSAIYMLAVVTLSSQRLTLRTGLVLLAALTAVLAIAGCAATAGTSPGAGSAQRRPALTRAQARLVFSGYAAATARAARTGDRRLALSVVTGVQRAVLAAAPPPGTKTPGPDSPQLDDLRPDVQHPDTFRPDAFYLPEADSYPRFFVVAATRAGPPARALLLFEQARPAAQWKLSSVSALAAGTDLPRLAADRAGYVPVVYPAAAGLLARPDSVGALQAAVVDEGPASASAAVVTPGPLTTGLYAAARARTPGRPASPGQGVTRGPGGPWELEGSRLPLFALRTADGGALVLYAMSLHGLGSRQLLSFAAADPAPGQARVQVIAGGGGPAAAAS